MIARLTLAATAALLAVAAAPAGPSLTEFKALRVEKGEKCPPAAPPVVRADGRSDRIEV